MFLRLTLLTALAVTWLGSSAVRAEPLERANVPEPLRPWIDWVLREVPDAGCPFLPPDADERERPRQAERRCAWPSRLELELDGSGGRFTQEWQLYREAWVPLPGDTTLWPEDVRDGEREVVRVERGGAPQVRLAAGAHRLRGTFRWRELPEHLPVPLATGLVALRLNGAAVANPERDSGGRLFLQRAPAKATEDARLDVSVNRLLTDDVPLHLESRITLRVAGPSRELQIGPALPAGFVPMSLDSALPARVEPDGRIRVQLRAGTWTITLLARGTGGPAGALALPALAPDAAPGSWDASEVWVFGARPTLRVADVEGVPAVDPQQTELPDEWRGLPAFRVDAGATLQLVEQRRGDSDPAPDQLRLQRTLWLDFDGGGYTWHDEIAGALRRSWRLEAAPPVLVGRMSIDGRDQLITRLADGESAPVGIEVRQGQAQIGADGRIEGGSGRVPATGWSQDFENVSLELRLPPGWRLLHASGADRIALTWISGWDLLKIFGVIIAAAAFGQLFGAAWGLVAGLTFTLIWPEPDAPSWIWVFVLACVALDRVVPSGARLAPALRALHWSSIALVLLIAIPFSVQQIRQAVYPALGERTELRRVSPAREESFQARTEVVPAAPPEAAEAEEGAAQRRPLTPGERRIEFTKLNSPRGLRPGYEPDPQAVVSTGPGLPTWSWGSAELKWDGPVTQGQDVQLWLVPPWINFALGWLRVALIGALLLCLIDPQTASGRRLQAWRVLPLLLLTLFGVGTPRAARAADVPPDAILSELRARLTELPECFPACATSARLRVEAKGDLLRLRVELEVAALSGVLLPGGLGRWSPSQVLRDGKPVESLAHDAQGRLWIALPPGRHQLLLEGSLAGRDTAQVPLPLRPHRIESELDGWRLEGVRPDGTSTADSLELARVRSEAAPGSAQKLAPQEFPPFVTVERTLRLGLSWSVETSVARETPAERSVFVDIPLLAGESVTDANVRVENGRVRVELPAGQPRASWSSTLPQGPALALIAPDAASWTEVWRVDPSPIWHVDATGIPVVHSDTTPSIRIREWRPWPGERVALAITRPAGVEGRTLTLDAARLDLVPGARARDFTLELTLRSSRGGNHELMLPVGADLQQVTIDGALAPVRAVGGRLTLPVRPGRHQALIQWRTAEPLASVLHTPAVDLGAPAVNGTLAVSMPHERWILLTGGPRLGPAVLFWGALVVALLIAAGLGRLTLTPLGVGSWFLLFVGLTQVSVELAASIVGWLLALGLRRRYGAEIRRNLTFDLVQLLLVVATAVAAGALISAVQAGLLGLPEMQIRGNESNAYQLFWYQDRTADSLPEAWVLSVPLFVYRGAMLAWASWLAFALTTRWLRWAWTCFAAGGLWRPLRRRVEPPLPS